MLPNTWAFYGSRWWTPAVRKAPKTDILHESVQKLHIFAFVSRRQSKQVEEIYCQLEGGLAWVGLGGSKLKLTLLRYLRAEGNFISWAPISRMCPWNFKIWKETLRFAPVCREPKNTYYVCIILYEWITWFGMNVGSFTIIHNQCLTGYFHQLNSLQVRLGSWVEYCSAGVFLWSTAQPEYCTLHNLWGSEHSRTVQQTTDRMMFAAGPNNYCLSSNPDFQQTPTQIFHLVFKIAANSAACWCLSLT